MIIYIILYLSILGSRRVVGYYKDIAIDKRIAYGVNNRYRMNYNNYREIYNRNLRRSIKYDTFPIKYPNLNKLAHGISLKSIHSTKLLNPTPIHKSNGITKHKRIPKIKYYSTFEHYTELKWYYDDDDNYNDWPGTNKLQPGITYDAVIRYFFTPLRALVFLTKYRVEACLTSDNLPEPYCNYPLKDLFKPSHLIHVKPKEPLTLDVKNRPEVVISTDKLNTPVVYSSNTKTTGTPIFACETMAVLQLDHGEHQAQVFMNDLGINSSYSPPYYMNQVCSRTIIQSDFLHRRLSTGDPILLSLH